MEPLYISIEIDGRQTPVGQISGTGLEDAVFAYSEDYMIPEKKMTQAQAKRAMDDLREEAASLPEMTLEEINAEI